MNIYICSTVRHLLFALCRANAERQEQHYLVFFADYQGASLSDWNLAELPDHIHLDIQSRKNFRSRLERSFIGRCAYQYSRTLWSAPAKLREPVIDTLMELSPALAARLGAEASFTLWLFNDRNRMARLFRLLSPNFNIIEDGESNYLQYAMPWWKWSARLLLGQTSRRRSIGDDPRCKEIWVNYPERLVPLLRQKAHAINFLGSDTAVALIKNIFAKNQLPAITSKSVILATQPVDGMATMPVEDKQKIYATIVSFVEKKGCQLILKLHPAEQASDYDFLAGRVVSAPAQVPVEALLLSATDRPTILSISSSAGLGFERFCSRIKLIENNDFVTIRRWARHPEELLTCLEESMLVSKTGDVHARICVGHEQHHAVLS